MKQDSNRREFLALGSLAALALPASATRQSETDLL